MTAQRHTREPRRENRESRHVSVVGLPSPCALATARSAATDDTQRQCHAAALSYGRGELTWRCP
eukprot:366496-Chlamydomonas_euryale.AAC.29